MRLQHCHLFTALTSPIDVHSHAIPATPGNYFMAYPTGMQESIVMLEAARVIVAGVEMAGAVTNQNDNADFLRGYFDVR